MIQNTQITAIGILAYPGAQASAVYGLTDIFQIANQYRAEQGADNCELTVDHLKITHLTDKPYAAIIIPPSMADVPFAEDNDHLIEWIISQHQQGALICSICAGAFLLGATGLLDQRPATTHWTLKDDFANQFPAVALDTDQLIIDDNDIITAGGLMAWTDLALRLVDRFLGPAAMLSTARFFLVDPGGREQRFYSLFSPSLNHGDDLILKVQHWLQAHSSEALTVPDMANTAGLSERTFLRRFHKATGLNPSVYIQHLRVGKARELMELSKLSVDEIAWQVGYQDPGTFRRVFYKIMGLTPREYRGRFATH